MGSLECGGGRLTHFAESWLREGTLVDVVRRVALVRVVQPGAEGRVHLVGAR